MKIDEFVEKFDMAPLELYEFAEFATKVEDHKHLKARAEGFLESQQQFIDMLEEVGVEIG